MKSTSLSKLHYCYCIVVVLYYVLRTTRHLFFFLSKEGMESMDCPFQRKSQATKLNK